MLRNAFFVLFLVGPQIYACGCVGLYSKCDLGWNLGETIFLGKTIAMERITSGYAAHFQVEESYRGERAIGGEIVAYTGLGGGDCGYPFVPGTSYLVYASMFEGRLQASICSQTTPAVMAEGVLRELRAIRDHAPTDDVFGMIGIAPKGSGYGDLTDSRPLPKIRVSAANSKGAMFTAETDERGVYAFPRLPAGAYSIQPDLPKGFAGHAPFAVEVGAGSCRVDHFAKPDGQIEGTVIDGSGKPVAGFVTIQPDDPGQPRGGLSGYDVGSDGKFSLPQLPPGSYRLVFHPQVGGRIDFRATAYWPPKTEDPIDLAFGQHIDALEFKVH